jgi:hypothetical protein
MASDATNAMHVASDVGALFPVVGSAFGLFAGLSDADGGPSGAFVVAFTVALLAGSGSAIVLFEPAIGGLAGPVRLASALGLPLALALAGGVQTRPTSTGVALPADGRDGVNGADELDPPSPGGPATIDGAPPALTDDDTCSTPGLFGVSLQLS